MRKGIEGDHFLLVGICLILSVTQSCYSCPLPADSPCGCEFNATGKNEYIINCRYKPLGAIPNFTDSSIPVYELALYSCGITDLPADAFSVLNVQRIDLGANPIRNIHLSAFIGIGDTLTELVLDVDQNSPPDFPRDALSALPLLKLLHVRYFNMPQLPVRALSSLVNLEELSIQQSKLTQISASDFSEQDELKVLRVSSNSLTELPTEALAVLEKLQKLDLTHNGIEDSIATDSFKNNLNLQEIDLSNNRLYPIAEGAFKGVEQSLKILHLRSNHITAFDLGKLSSLQNVEDLDLSYNQDLNAIGNGVFANMHSLTKLNLYGCFIKVLTNNAFDGIKDSLLSLLLAENQLNTIGANTFKGFTKLQQLTLDHQPLTDLLQGDIFEGLEDTLQELSLENTVFKTQNWPAVTKLKSLSNLKLKNNQIDSVPDFSLEQLTALQTLDLSLNNISQIDQRSMHGPKSSLSTIELGKNQVTTFDKCTFDGFTSLKHIGIADNPLHCDCHLIWLRLWVDQAYDDFGKQILQWSCGSPAALQNRYFARVSVQQLEEQCDVLPSPKVCEDLTSSTSTTSTTTTTTTPLVTDKDGVPSTPTTQYPQSDILSVTMSNITITSAVVQWQIKYRQLGLETFDIVVKYTDKNQVFLKQTVDSNTREYLIENLDPATHFQVCVTMWITDDVTYASENACTDFTTKTDSSSLVQAGTPISTILGAVVGIIVLILLILIVGFLVHKYKLYKRCPVGSKDKKNQANSHHSPSGISLPQAGAKTKRYSKEKATSIEIEKQNAANKHFENYINHNTDPINRHIDLHEDLERFSPEEQERILNMLTHSGGSHLSTISMGNQRYLPELPPRPYATEGYLNPQVLRDEPAIEEPHIYVEIDDEPQISKECYI